MILKSVAFYRVYKERVKRGVGIIQKTPITSCNDYGTAVMRAAVEGGQVYAVYTDRTEKRIDR